MNDNIIIYSKKRGDKVYNYNNYIHSRNATAKTKSVYFQENLKGKMATDSSKSMFSQSLEVNKNAINKYENLSRIKSSFLNSYANATVVSTGGSSTGNVSNDITSDNTEIKDNKTNTFKVLNGKGFDADINGKNVTFTCKNGQVYMSDYEEKLDSFDMTEVGRVEQIITSLAHDASANYVKSNYTNAQIKNILDKVGIKPGEFSINTSTGINKFYMLDSGKIYSNYEIESTRNFYNNTDFKKCFGYSDYAVCKINDKEYKIGEDGSFNIPKGVVCVPENMIITK